MGHKHLYFNFNFLFDYKTSSQVILSRHLLHLHIVWIDETRLQWIPDDGAEPVASHGDAAEEAAEGEGKPLRD